MQVNMLKKICLVAGLFAVGFAFAQASALYWGGERGNWVENANWYDNAELAGEAQEWTDGRNAVIADGSPAVNADVIVNDLTIESGAAVRIGAGDQTLTVQGTTAGSGNVSFSRTRRDGSSVLRFKNAEPQTVAWGLVLESDQARARFRHSGSATLTLNGSLQAWGNEFDIYQDAGSHLIIGPDAQINNNRPDLVNARPFRFFPADQTAILELHENFNADLADTAVTADEFPFAKTSDDSGDGVYVKPVGGMSTWQTVSGTTITHHSRNLASIHKYTGGEKRYTHHGLWDFVGTDEPAPVWIVRSNPQSYDGGIYFIRDWTLNTEKDFTFEGLWHEDVNIGFATRSGAEDITFTKKGAADFIIKGTQAYGPGTTMRVAEGRVLFHTDPMIGAEPLAGNPFWFGGTGNHLRLEVAEGATAVFLPPAGETFHLAAAEIAGGMTVQYNGSTALAVSGEMNISGTLVVETAAALDADEYVVATAEAGLKLSGADLQSPSGWQLVAEDGKLVLRPSVR